MKRKAFSLIELLVVVGIIAVLLSILLPTVGAVRKQARASTCLAHLRQIGQGFHVYAMNFEGAFPVAVHHNSGYLKIGVPERRWYDLIAPYVADNRIRSNDYDDVKRMRHDSVIWGCPEYIRAHDITTDPYSSDSPTAEERRPGYGMNYRPASSSAGSGGTNSMAYIDGRGTPVNGQYVRREQWTKPTERGLIACSPRHIIEMPAALTRSSRWGPFDDKPPTPLTFGDFYIDARHGEAVKDWSYLNPSVGMLFCDGHARLVSVREAWNAFKNPGEDKAGP